MKFFTCYKWQYKIKDYTIFNENLEVEVCVNKDKTWNISKIGFLGPNYLKVWLESDSPLFKFIADIIEKDPKFNQSVLNETL